MEDPLYSLSRRLSIVLACSREEMTLVTASFERVGPWPLERVSCPAPRPHWPAQWPSIGSGCRYHRLSSVNREEGRLWSTSAGSDGA